MRRPMLWRPLCVALISVLTFTTLPGSGVASARQDATPTVYSCETAATPMPGMSTPMASMTHSDMSTPAASAEFDLLYIDMMIPHHASIVALAQAALPQLSDERLRTLAETIIDAQTTEIDELRGYRVQFSGSADPMPLDEQAMMQLMPELTMPMDAMMAQMDAATQVTLFCAADDADLAFIDLTIPHHQSAIVASEAALQRAVHPEIQDFARQVIDAQRREIDELSGIRQNLSGSATPEAIGGEHGGAGHIATNPAITDQVTIRSLTPEQIAQIERGEGAGFALPAELNGVPGPRHVLDLGNDLGLSAEQQARVQAIFDTMQTAAIPAGERYLGAVQALEEDFRSGTLTEAAVSGRVAEVSRLQGDLATIHLVAHLQTVALLTPEQIAIYQGERP